MKENSIIIIKRTNQLATVLMVDNDMVKVFFKANYDYYLWFKIDELDTLNY